MKISSRVGTIIMLAGIGSACAATPMPDLIVYCASPGGIMTAVAAARDGANVLVVEPTAYVGGIVAQGGLVLSDLGRSSTIGGLAKDFFVRIERHYSDTYGRNSPQREHTKFEGYPGGCFEPRVAELIYEQYLADSPRIRVLRGHDLVRVEKDGTRITAIVVADDAGRETTLRARLFADASYTGDLYAMAGASYRIGREAVSETGEPSARNKPDPAIQAYNYRVTMTRNPANLVPIEKPDDYDPANYDWHAESIQRNQPHRLSNIFRPYWRLPNDKQDTNVADLAGKNWDYPEASRERRRELERIHRNYSLGFLYFLQHDPRVPEVIREEALKWGLPRDEFPDNGHFPRAIYVREARRLVGDYLLREQDLTTDRRKPDGIALGSYAIDSHSVKMYKDNQGRWQREGYVYIPVLPYAIPYRSLLPKREEVSNLLVPVTFSATHLAWASARMEPVFMMTGEAAGAAAALALETGKELHAIDTDALRARLTAAGALVDVPPEPTAAFTWSPREPAAGEPVTFTYVATDGAATPVKFYWDFNGDGKPDARSESASFTFAQAKQTLVSLVVEDAAGELSVPVAHVVSVGGADAGDLQLDAEDRAVKKQALTPSLNQKPYWGTGFHHDSNSRKGGASATYTFAPAQAGRYTVYISSTTGGRSTNTPVTVTHADGETTVRVSQYNPGNPLGLVEVGTWTFTPESPAVVVIGNAETDNYVVMDAVRLVLQQD